MVRGFRHLPGLMQAFDLLPPPALRDPPGVEARAVLPQATLHVQQRELVPAADVRDAPLSFEHVLVLLKQI